MVARERDIEQVAADLRELLVERRREEATAGRPAATSLPEQVAALPPRRRLRRGAAQPAAGGRRPGGAPAPLLRRGCRARSRPRGRPGRYLASSLHRPAGGRDADWRGPLRGGGRAGLPAQGGCLARGPGDAGAGCRAPADRIPRDPAARPGGGSTATARGTRVAGLLGGALAALAAAPVAPGRLSWLVAAALPAAGFVAPDALAARRRRRRTRAAVAGLPDALDLLAVATVAGRNPIAAFAEIAAAASGPLAEELAALVAEVECGRPSRRRSRRFAFGFPGRRSPRSARLSSDHAASARRLPISSRASLHPCVAGSAARSRSVPPVPRPRSSSSSPWSSSPRYC